MDEPAIAGGLIGWAEFSGSGAEGQLTAAGPRLGCDQPSETEHAAS